MPHSTDPIKGIRDVFMFRKYVAALRLLLMNNRINQNVRVSIHHEVARVEQHLNKLHHNIRFEFIEEEPKPIFEFNDGNGY